MFFFLVFCVSQPLRLTIILVSCFMFWCVFPTASLYDLIMDLQLPMIQSNKPPLLSLVTFSISLITVSRLCQWLSLKYLLYGIVFTTLVLDEQHYPCCVAYSLYRACPWFCFIFHHSFPWIIKSQPITLHFFWSRLPFIFVHYQHFSFFHSSGRNFITSILIPPISFILNSFIFHEKIMRSKQISIKSCLRVYFLMNSIQDQCNERNQNTMEITRTWRFSITSILNFGERSCGRIFYRMLTTFLYLTLSVQYDLFERGNQIKKRKKETYDYVLQLTKTYFTDSTSPLTWPIADCIVLLTKCKILSLTFFNVINFLCKKHFLIFCVWFWPLSTFYRFVCKQFLVWFWI